MKRLRGDEFDAARIPASKEYLQAAGLPSEAAWGDDYNGCFTYLSPVGNGDVLRILAGSDDHWDHVSVSLAHRCPIWSEMDWVKRLFFKDSEVAYQLHVKPSNHINCHPYTLHLWRPKRQKIPQPPSYMV